MRRQDPVYEYRVEPDQSHAASGRAQVEVREVREPAPGSSVEDVDLLHPAAGKPGRVIARRTEAGRRQAGSAVVLCQVAGDEQIAFGQRSGRAPPLKLASPLTRT